MQQKGGPAHRSGQIAAGDLLQRVQNIDADGNVAEGAASLGGLEGTAVQLTFKRGFHSADIWAVKLRRMKGCDDELALAAPGFEFPSLGPAPVAAVVASVPPAHEIAGDFIWRQAERMVCSSGSDCRHVQMMTTTRKSHRLLVDMSGTQSPAPTLRNQPLHSQMLFRTYRHRSFRLRGHGRSQSRHHPKER
jgi:hypothetical protein